MDRSRPLVIKLLENNREIKFKMVLHCTMEKTNIKTGEVESHPKAFHSEIGINLVGTFSIRTPKPSRRRRFDT